MTIDDLGPRVCIMGPSNSGKSTLAEAIARARGLPAIHLDQLYHLPDTDWQPRPELKGISYLTTISAEGRPGAAAKLEASKGRI